MSQSAQFNPLPLLSVMPGIASSLEQIGGDLNLYFSGPDRGRDALQNALVELHRVCGVLQMVSLKGVTRYGEEIEKLLQELAAGSLAPSPAHRDIVQRSLTALAHYLEALIDGASNATLRLFHQYQELQQARGVEMSFEVDLFFPELSVELPQSVLGIPQQADSQSRIKSARSQYQQALLKWLRQNNPAEALQQMRTAVITVMTCVPQDQRRAFWWIATGVLDCLIFDGAPPGLNAKGLLSRVDLQMKALLEGIQADNYPTLSEMLYLLARSHVVSELVGGLKQTYALDDYLPDDSSLPLSQTAQVLEQMRTQLGVARESWENCLQGEDGAGDAQSCQEFIKQADQLRALAEGLDRNTLQFLSTQIHSGAAQCVEPERAQRIAQDMAMAMLLLEIGIDQYSHLGSNYHDQARILAQRLQSSMMHMPEDAEKFAEVIALHSEMEKRKILGPLANEMQGNLQHVEQGLNAFFSDLAKREEVAPLGHLLHQVLAAMHLLSLVQAEQLLLALQQTVERYAAGSNPAPAEMRAVALALSAIGIYVQNLAHGQKSDVSPLHSALQVMEAAQRPSAVPAPAETQPVPATPAKPAPVVAAAAVVEEEDLGGDEDMQEVFLEEAQEVLEILRINLESSQLHMESREPLVTIRRGFHTLKGSGRMVGLAELGEVAWAMESAMNVWLDKGKPATPELLKFIGDAARLFQTWIEKLTQHETAKFDYAALLATSQQIVSGVELPSAQPQVETQVPVAEQPAEPEFKLDLESLPDLTFEAPPPQPEIKLEPIAQPAPEFEPAFKLELEALPEPMQESQLQTESVKESVPQPVPEAPPQPARDVAVTSEADNMSSELFQISTQEAEQNVAALQNHLGQLLTRESPEIPYDFMRAAHTLGGVHRAMGSLDGADLAHALESWLQVRMDRPFTLNEMQLAMLKQAVAALHDIGLAVSHHQPHPAQPQLISQLQADTEESAPEKIKEETIKEETTNIEAAKLQPATPIPAAPAISAIPAIPATPPPREITQPEPAGAADPVADELITERVVRDDLDEQLLPIFLEEAADIYTQISSNLRSWIERPGEEKYSQNLQRTLHTLKGSARMVGAMRLGELTHLTETHVGKPAAQHDAAFWEELESYFDRIGSTLERLRSGTPTEAIAQAAPTTAPETTPIPVPDGKLAQIAAPQAASQSAELPVAEISSGSLAAAMLRVRSDMVDSLVNEAGEISVVRSRIEGELRGFKSGLQELTNSVERLRKQLREIEIQAEAQMQARVTLSTETAEQFDPLEFDRFTHFQDLTRSMNESVHDVQTVQQALLKNLDETSAALTAQSHLNRELQQSLMSIRMVPFSTLSERLYRIIRRTGKELGKRVNLELQGGDIELDRSMLEKMTAPFEHMLRNSIDHGLESAEERLRKNKPPIGEIRLSLRQSNNEVEFEFTDDGAGLNIERLHKKAIELGIFKEGEAVNENQIMQVIFATGLSTASGVSEISGRGVGMDVVRSDIMALGGRIDVFSERDKGARFVIHLPLTLAVAQTLMVRAAHETYAINTGMIEQVQQIKHAGLVEIYDKGAVEWNGNYYPLFNLMRLLGNENYQPESHPYNPVLLLRSSGRRMALHVDELIGNQEVVIKNIGPQLARLPGIAGATVLGNGKVVLILNPIALEQYASGAQMISKAKAATAPVTVAAAKLLVMVVDDSLTVRKVTSRMLIRAGYQVVTANDGVDALEKLAEFTPDMMLLDIEMPRMDGFELTKRLRSDPRYKQMPIIIITSRAAEKHRLYALELGVNAYLGKPYQEVELLEHVKFYSEEELHNHANFHRAEGLLQQIASFISPHAAE